MTPQEAIGFLNQTKAGCNILRDKQLLDVCNIAISAFEKQIPKKVKKIKFSNGIINYGCPVCGRKIISKIDGKFCGGDLSNHCDRCGQALGWD